MRGPSAVAAIAAATTLAVEVRSWSVSPISIGLTKLQNPRPQRRHHDRLPSTNNERRSRRPAVAGTALHSGSSDDVQHQLRSMGLNELQTQFRLAIAREDMDAAIIFRDELADRVSSGAYREIDDDEDAEVKNARLSWKGLGTAPWLVDRVEALGYPLPTTIQINSFEAVNVLLSTVDQISLIRSNADDTLEERLESRSPQNFGVVISGSTGSGKTLAYMVPTLSTLSQTLFTRQRIRLKAEEDVGDMMGDLLDRVMVQASPSVRGQGYEQVGGKEGRGALTGAALASLGKSGTDVKSPVALIVVPTRELGVQIALLLFELVGGNKKGSATESSGRRNMFKYKGPKGVKIGCVLDDNTAKEGLKLQTDVAITTPQYLGRLLQDGDIDPSMLRVVVYDEADLGLEQTSEEILNQLFENKEQKQKFSRISYLVGATVTESLASLAVKDEVLPDGKSFIATATRFAPLTKEDELDVEGDTSGPMVGIGSSPDSRATLSDLGLCLDPGLRHERVVTTYNTELLCLARMLRQELKDFEAANELLAESVDDESDTLLKQLEELREETKDLEQDSDLASVFAMKEPQNKLQKPRVVVFFPDEDEAKDAIFSLRDAMWGDHKIGVLLPKGEQPLSIMEAFKNGDLSVLLATPNSVRGLDFPALTHVYTLFLPSEDPREYLHLAGRVGRIGQQGSVKGIGGRVTAIIDPDEANAYDEMAKFLGFDYEDISPPESAITDESDVEDVRRFLEDSYTLLGTAEDFDEKSPSENEGDEDKEQGR